MLLKKMSTALMAGALMGWTAPAAYANGERYVVGIRANALAAGGEPSNDMLGVGVYGYYRLQEGWYLGAALDRAGYDFERPYRILGLAAEEIDADASSTSVSAWIERRYAHPGRRLTWFWGAGVGFSSVDVDDVSGPTSGGGTFDITTDAGTETLLVGSAGFRYALADGSWALRGALRVDHHLADWKVVDRASGRSDTIDDYTATGIHIGIERSF